MTQAEKANGGPDLVHLRVDQLAGRHPRPAQYLQQAWQQVGFQVKTTIVQQNETINNALAGKYQALGWRQFGAVDPDLNYIFWSTTTVSSGSLSINMARNADPQIEKAAADGPPEHGQGPAGDGLQDGQQAPWRWTCPTCGRPGGLGRHRQPHRAELQQPHHAVRASPPSA